MNAWPQVSGSEWCEAVITASLRGLGGPPHGHPSRWDWGMTVKSLALAQMPHGGAFEISRKKFYQNVEFG